LPIFAADHSARSDARVFNRQHCCEVGTSSQQTKQVYSLIRICQLQLQCPPL